MLVLTALISLFVGAGLSAGVAFTSRSVERAAHKREVATYSSLLIDEHGRTNDLLTRLAARSVTEYRNATGPETASTTTRIAYLTDPTGLITVDADDDGLEA